MARSYARVASDVNMAEEAEMRAMEGGSDFFGTPLTQAATHGTSSQGGAPSESPFPPARQPASGAESRRGDGEQQPGDQQPDPDQQPGAAGAAGAGEGAGCTPGGSSSSSSADPAVGGVYAEDAPPQPTLYTEGTAAIQVQVENIHNDHKGRSRPHRPTIEFFAFSIFVFSSAYTL